MATILHPDLFDNSLIGPSDGSFMVGCDNCDKWFHGSCMKIDKAASETLTKWICPPCSGEQTPVHGGDSPVHDKPPPVTELSPLLQHISPHAPNPMLLWPPLGLRTSGQAIEALGKIGDSDNEDFVQNETPASRKDPTPSKVSTLPAAKDAPKSQKVVVTDAASKTVAHECHAKPFLLKSSPKIILKIPAQSTSLPLKTPSLSGAPKAVIKTPMQIRAEIAARAKKSEATLATSPQKNATAGSAKVVLKTAQQTSTPITSSGAVQLISGTKTTASSSLTKAAATLKPAPQSVKSATVGGAPKMAAQPLATGTTRTASGPTVGSAQKIPPKIIIQSGINPKPGLKPPTSTTASSVASKLQNSAALHPSPTPYGGTVAHSSLQRPNSGIRYPRSENTAASQSGGITVAPFVNASSPIVSNQIHNSVQATSSAPTAMEIDPQSASGAALEKDKPCPSEAIPVSTPCISNGSKNHATNLT